MSTDSEIKAVNIALQKIADKLLEIDKTLLWFRIERDRGLERIASLENQLLSKT